MTDDTPARPLEFAADWEKAVVPNGGGTATLLLRIKPIQSAAAAETRSPVDVAFVLDRSGSMSGGKLELAKHATATAISLMHDDDRAALVVFDNNIDRVHALEATTPRVKTAMRLALQQVECGGSTNLSGGWLSGCEELAEHPATHGGRTIQRAILLTDGQANVGIVDPNELMHHAAELRRRGISTTTMGVGADFDELLLSGMAEAGGGNFQYIAGADDLPAFFERELGELLSIVASDLTLSLTLPHGMRGTLINAFPSERTGKTITVYLGDLAATDELALVFDVTIAAGEIGRLQRIALSASWTKPGTTSEERAEIATRPVATMNSILANAAPPNPDVAEEAAVQRAAAIQREAMRLDREGRIAESRAHLAHGVQYLAAAPKSARVMESMAAMNQLAEADASFELPSQVRKQATHDAMHRSRGKQDNRPG